MSRPSAGSPPLIRCERVLKYLALKGFLRLWQDIVVACKPNVERWQDENAHGQSCNQASHDYDREWPLRIRSDGVRESGWQKPKRRHEHGHHDWAKPEDRTLDRSVHNGMSFGAQLVDVFQHDDAGLHRDAEKCEETHARGDAEKGMRNQKGQHSAKACHSYGHENKQGPFG